LVHSAENLGEVVYIFIGMPKGETQAQCAVGEGAEFLVNKGGTVKPCTRGNIILAVQNCGKVNGINERMGEANNAEIVG
jgi:hypothetical protein